ncbi:uncharacterized protein LOC125236723 [Leguminivora glycinivorella]|uniref:uncharacterized protein LOC125236723 n=1 Tax=Leguminivora glycinivorella TaxID=1035111 RepID=UPI00200C9574|nr:uncharacterized protein LOC125236723 [Leguminivora glycinivorella]
MKSTGTQDGKQSSYGYRECIVDGALALVLRISRCSGVAPLCFTPVETGWRIAVSPRLAWLQNVFMTVISMVCLTAVFLDFLEDPDERIRIGESAVTAFVWIADFVLVLAIASLAVYRGSTRMERLIRLLTELQQIDLDLNNTRCVKTEKKGILVVTVMVVSILSIQFVEVYLKTQSFIEKDYNWSIMIMYSSYYVANYLGILALLQWGFVALALYRAAATVNQRLLRLHHEHFAAYPLQLQSMIRRLASSYGHTGELMRQMNEINGTIIIAILMADFLHLVITPYYLLLNLDSNAGMLLSVMIPFLWSLMHSATLMLTVEPCHWTQEQRETTKFLLSRVTVRLAPKSKLLARELDQFAKQIVLANVKFSPLGVLTLGRPLVASVLQGSPSKACNKFLTPLGGSY